MTHTTRDAIRRPVEGMGMRYVHAAVRCVEPLRPMRAGISQMTSPKKKRRRQSDCQRKRVSNYGRISRHSRARVSPVRLGLWVEIRPRIASILAHVPRGTRRLHREATAVRRSLHRAASTDCCLRAVLVLDVCREARLLLTQAK